MKIFPRGFNQGDPISKKGFASGLTAMARAWETLSVNVGKVDWNNGRPKIIVNRTQLAALSRNEMFAVYQSGETSVKVRAGIAARWDGRGTANVIRMTVDGDGTSWDPSDVKTLEGITSSQWINLSLDEDEDPRGPLDPATLTAEKTGSTTETDGEDGLEIPIAYVECEEGKITRIVQAHSGPWYLPVIHDAAIDEISVDLNASDELQLRAFDDIPANLVPIDLDNDVYIPVTEATEGEDHEIRYSNLNDMVQEIIDIVEEYIEEEVVIVTSWDGLNDTSGTPGIELTHGYIPVSDKNSGSLDLKEPSEAGLPFWIQDSDYEDCYGSSIGDSLRDMIIDLDNQELVTAFTAKMDFTVEGELYTDMIRDLDENMLMINLGTGTLAGASMMLDLHYGVFELLNDDPFPEDNWFQIKRSNDGTGIGVNVSGHLRSWDLESAIFDLYSTDVFRLGLNLDEETDVLETVNPLAVESPELALRGTTSLDLQYGATGVRFGPEEDDPLTFPGAKAMEVVLQASPTSPPQRVRILGAVLGPV
jgi:hypothetical protein